MVKMLKGIDIKMRIEKIVWIDKTSKEAEVYVTDGEFSIICFSQPCEHVIGGVLKEPIKVLDIHDIQIAESKYEANQIGSSYSYKIQGEVDKEKSIIKISNIFLHFDVYKLPGDIVSGNYISARVDRFDLW